MVDLYTETEINCYDPGKILEIIYNEKSVWDRIKIKTKNTIKKVPSLILSLLMKIISIAFSFLGLNGGMSSLIWNLIPTKLIMDSLVKVLIMFFPVLAPVFGLSKLIF